MKKPIIAYDINSLPLVKDGKKKFTFYDILKIFHDKNILLYSSLNGNKPELFDPDSVVKLIDINSTDNETLKNILNGKETTSQRT